MIYLFKRLSVNFCWKCICGFIICTFILSSCAGKPQNVTSIFEREAIPFQKFEGKYFSFEYASDAIFQHTDTIDKNYWFDLIYPKLQVTIYCSYLPITRFSLNDVLQDSYKLAYSHVNKADGIKEHEVKLDENRIFGILYEIEGNVATPIQFYVTDNETNFLRGSLYYDRAVKSDSVTQITQSLREDVFHLIGTLRWSK